ncbi:Uncharacterised protein [Mycobacteroides abscessus subsp. abscessus]|nr:Uncharacterised protein [Mycobacteroides abscessus subsp. abscessus]
MRKGIDRLGAGTRQDGSGLGLCGYLLEHTDGELPDMIGPVVVQRLHPVVVDIVLDPLTLPTGFTYVLSCRTP